MLDQQSMVGPTDEHSPYPLPNDRIRELLAQLVEVAATAASKNRPHLRNALERALTMFINVDLESKAPRPFRFGGLAPWQAKRIMDFIEANLGTSLTTSDLASLTRLSTSHFHRAFKARFGETPKVCIMRKRVLRAQQMMLTTTHPLAQIALQCGMCDQAHFSRLFRQHVGLSPQHWRRQNTSELRAPAIADTHQGHALQ